jgi:hypothetical protein
MRLIYVYIDDLVLNAYVNIRLFVHKITQKKNMTLNYVYLCIYIHLPAHLQNETKMKYIMFFLF